MGEGALSISKQQLDSLRDELASGLARAVEQIEKIHTRDVGAELGECQAGSLASLPDGAACLEVDLIAGVLARFDGGIAGTALFAMDPEDALGWVRARQHSATDPIDTYLQTGRCFLAELVREMADRFGTECELGAPSLQEESVASVLLGTHAPSDTAVISLRIELAIGDRTLPACIYLLMEPKRLECALVAC